jgi:ADP-ribose pyrophosphatase YjhB (NUDIX family)
MATLGPGNFVLVVLPVGGSKASDIKLVLKREPRNVKTWFLAGSFLPNEELVDAAVRELFEETSLTLIVDDFTLLSGNHVQVPFHDRKFQLVYVFLAMLCPVYGTRNLRTPAKVEQAVTAQSTIHSDGFCVIPTMIDIDGLSLTPFKIGIVREVHRKHELLHFGSVAQWEAF